MGFVPISSQSKCHWPLEQNMLLQIFSTNIFCAASGWRSWLKTSNNSASWRWVSIQIRISHIFTLYLLSEFSTNFLSIVSKYSLHYLWLQVVLALAVKYLFYEDWEENCRIRKTYLEELERKCVEEASESDSVSVDTNTSERFRTVYFKITLHDHKVQVNRLFEWSLTWKSLAGGWSIIISCRSTLRPHTHEMDRSSNSTGNYFESILYFLKF